MGDSRPLLVLVGFMGAGKTTVGQAAAQRLGWHFCDLDARIEAAAGLTIPAIFQLRGEPAYRDLETAMLRQVLRECVGRPTVLALGGGTVVRAENRAALQTAGAVSVFLEVPFEDLLQRCAGVTNRPLFRDLDAFRKLYEERLPLYRLARHTVAASGPPAEVTEAVLELA